jgi:hypothetical protein
VATPTDAALMTAAIVTVATIIFLATDKAVTVAAAAIDPAATATDDPADVAAWTAIECRAELNLKMKGKA